MRKKLVAVTMCACLGMTLFACSKDNSNEETTTTSSGTGSSESETAYTADDLVDDTASDLNLLDYVELADYKGLTLTKSVTEVTEEDVKSEMEGTSVLLKSNDVTVEDGDTAVIDFVGKLNGVAFDGGTGTDYDLVIGSNSFIDGFEDGLIGVKKGETVDLNLTFPENYSEDLAGKDVVFTVTVNEIKRPAQLNDEWLAANTDYATLDEFTKVTREKLEADHDEAAQLTMENNALDDIVTKSTVKKYFKSFLEEGESQYEKYFNTYASYYNMELSELLAAQGMTQTDFDNAKQAQGVAYAKSAMVIYALAQDAGLSEEDEAYQTILNDLAGSYNMDVDTFNKTYGESVVKSSVMPEYVIDYIISNATVNTTTVQEEETTTAE